MNYVHYYNSPLGRLTVASDGIKIIGLWFEGQKYYGASFGDDYEEKALPVFKQTDRWLDLYFGGTVPDFTPPLGLKSTEFRMAVWEILLAIPYGQTMTYGEIAGRIAGKRGLSRMSAQAVGGAVGHNPVSIIVPCHRVVGKGGSLTGYAGGIDRKLWLLTHENSGNSFGNLPVCSV